MVFDDLNRINRGPFLELHPRNRLVASIKIELMLVCVSDKMLVSSPHARKMKIHKDVVAP